MNKTNLFGIAAVLIVAGALTPNASIAGAPVTMAAADPNVTLYQLQKKCEELASETFFRETADDEDRVDYRAPLCGDLHISHVPVGINIWVYLSDLQGDRIYGGFHRSTNISLFYCNIEDKECHSEAEWDELVKPYMED